MTLDQSDPNEPTGSERPRVSVVEFVALSRTRVFIPMDMWVLTLQGLDFPLDGGGGIALVRLDEVGLGETAVVFAPPANALVALSEPFRLELAFARGEGTVLMGLGIPAPTPDGEALLFTVLDLGKPDNRECLSEFAAHDRVHLLLLDPRSGALLADMELRAPDLLAHVQMVLSDSADARPMDLTEGVLAYAQLYEQFFGRPS